MSEDVGKTEKGDVETPPKKLDNDSSTMENIERQLFLGFPMFIFIYRWIKKNASPYTRAGILVLGVGIFLSRQMKGYLGYLIQEYMMSRAEVKEGDEVYNMLLSWVSRQNFAKTSRNFVATLDSGKKQSVYQQFVNRRVGMSQEVKDKPDSLKYTPAKGTYPFWHKGNLFFFERALEANTMPRVENISISCFGRNPQSLKKLLEECREAFDKKDKGKTVIYNGTIRYSEGMWVRGLARRSRDFATIVLDADIKASIIKDLDNYLNSKQRLWYEARGIPYRRGYLLHGPPGTGKSSLSFAIAGYFKLKIYVLSLNASNMTEEVLIQLFNMLPSKCVILLEDVDAAGLTNRKTDPVESFRKKGEISLSALLNVIDGIASQEGRVLIMTTNHIHKLDAALIRPGRVDMTVEFKNADEHHTIQIFESIYKNAELTILDSDVDDDDDNDTLSKTVEEVAPVMTKIEIAEKASSEKAYTERISTLAREFATRIPKGRFTPAEIQGFLLRWKDEPETAVEKAAEWVVELIAMKAAAAAAEKEEEQASEMKEAKAQASAFQRMHLLQKELDEQMKKEEAELEKKLAGSVPTSEEPTADKSTSEESTAADKSSGENVNLQEKTEKSPGSSGNQVSEGDAKTIGPDANAEK